jgi:hypothetical protein
LINNWLNTEWLGFQFLNGAIESWANPALMYGMGFEQYNYRSFTFKILHPFLCTRVPPYNHPEYSPKKRSISMGNLGRIPPLPYLNALNCSP